jgi:hypothetical protein
MVENTEKSVGAGLQTRPRDGLKAVPYHRRGDLFTRFKSLRCIRFGTITRLVVAFAAVAFAQGRIAAQLLPQPNPPASPRESAPIDLTGYWVSIVNEDWRWRMLTPEKGDYPGVPLNRAGQDAAKAWNPATDGACEAYGAAALLRMPTRLHVTWEGDRVLKVESDAGQQTRRLVFDTSSATGPRSRQGTSVASWQRTLPPPGFFGIGPPGPPAPGGSLKVVTTNLKPGWLRKNGVPYSEKAIVTEYFDRFPVPDGGEWFVVTTSVEDPTYLMAAFTTSSHFRREPDGSKWSPRACKGT